MSETESNLSTTPRLFVGGFAKAPLAVGAELALPAPQSHYLAQVMRRQIGDIVRVFDGASGEWAARVVVLGKKAVTLTVERLTTPQEQVADLWLCAAPLKRGRIDWMVEKACELGVARVVPVITARTIVERLNPDRLLAHMIEAAEQCGRTAVPELAEPVKLAVLLRDWPPDRTLFFADESGGQLMAQAIKGGGLRAAILIGPEGGFTPDEGQAIRANPAAIAISLGPRILRADTAATVALGLWQSLIGDRNL